VTSGLPALRAGAHVGGGISGYVRNALAANCDAIQVFASNPRGWAAAATSDAADARLRAELNDKGIEPVFIHSPYLVNPATPSPAFRAKSIGITAWTMRRAAAIGAAGVVVHAGQGGTTSTREEALVRAASAIREILAESPPGPALVVELTAGGPNAIATRWPHAAELLDAAGADDRIRFCFDTCHAHAAGYDLSTPDGAAECWGDHETTVGVERLAVVHANDSRDPCGSRRDRHEQVGKGTIGEAGFRALLAHPASRRVPWIVETSPRYQAQDIATLRRLAAEA